MSVDRARRVERELRAAVGVRIAGRITWQVAGRGAAALVVLWPQNEADRRRNRRVEVSFAPSTSRPASSTPPLFCGGAPSTGPATGIEAITSLVGQALSRIPVGLRFGLVPPTNVRFLFMDEQLMANKVFGRSLDYTRILLSDGKGVSGRAFTVAVPTARGAMVVILMGSTTRCFAASPHHASNLVHELVHAWQSQHHPDPVAFMSNSAACQARALAATPTAKAAAAALAVARAGAASVFDTRRLLAIAAEAARREAVSAYAYAPGKPFGAYAAEQIAQQVEHAHRRIGRPTPGVAAVVGAAAPHAVVAENVASLGVISFHTRSTPGVVFSD